MADTATSEFGALLRRHRLQAALTQEALAERAGLSVHGIQKLERGATRPYRDTTQRLVAALRLAGGERKDFLAAAAPPPRATRGPAAAGAGGAAKNNLPAPLTSFVGREREIVEVRKRLGEARLVSLTGAGGCGKTRLALEVATALGGRFLDGVWLVELASLTDPELVATTVARTLGVAEAPGRPITLALGAALRSRRLLLLLDNCEHLVDGCARLVDALLRTCPDLRVLATSRAALGVTGEAVYRVPSLAVPDRDATPNLAELASCESARLFCERAQLVRPDFVLTTGNAAAVAEVCRRLDGIPLAIELAAARVRVLTPEQIVARLRDRFHLLTGGRTAPGRQQTLRAAIDWSYDLLGDAERRLFRRLAVFAGGCTLEAAEAVGTGADVSAADVLDLLTALTDQSLVQVEEAGAAVRYRLLETVRQYGEEKLQEAGEAATVHSRHRDWYLAWAEGGAAELVGRDQAIWHRRFEDELNNFRGALDWRRAAEDGAEAELRLAAALGRFWITGGHGAEGCARLAAALERSGAGSSVARATALDWLGSGEARQGDWRRGEALLEQSVAMAKALGEQWLAAHALQELAVAHQYRGDHAATRSLGEEALAAARSAEDARETAFVLTILGMCALEAGDGAGARPLIEEGIATARIVGDTGTVAFGMLLVGWIAYMEGEYGVARRWFELALETARSAAHVTVTGFVLLSLGASARQRGDLGAAEAWFREALRLARDSGDVRQVAIALDSLAGLDLEAGRRDQAARVFGTVDGWLVVSGRVRDRLFQPTSEWDLATVHTAMGDASFAAAWAEGRAMTLEQAVAEALRADDGRG